MAPELTTTRRQPSLRQDSSLIGQPADKARLTLPSAPTTVDEPIFTTIVL